MKFLLLLIPLLMLCCATSEITLNRQAIKNVKSVAVVPFTSTMKLDTKIMAEAEDRFRAVLSELDYNVIGQNKMDSLLQTGEFSKTGITEDNVTSAKKILNADTVLFGKITVNEEKKISVRYHRFGMMVFDDDYDKTETKIFYRFKITLKLIKVNDGSVILTITNRYIEAEHDDDMPGYVTLDAYRQFTLEKMGNELKETMRSKN